MVPLKRSFGWVANERLCVSCRKPFVPLDMRQTRCKHTCQRDVKRSKPVTFKAIDGEGLGADPSVYVLLGCGQEQIENPDGLQWQECFRFLYSQFIKAGPNVAFVGFFLGYDFTQILKGLPEERARMLLTEEGQRKRKPKKHVRRGPFPVECSGWQFDILGMRRLKLRPKLCHCTYQSCKCAKASWMYICDVGGFWQTSFLNVINPENWSEPVVTPEEYETIKRGKEKRSSAVLDEEMRFYNRLENEILERVMNSLNMGFEGLSIHLSPMRWFGPGQSAAAWMRKRLPKRDVITERVPDWFAQAARKSYYGGWFEIMAHGIVRGITHEYDINSAYPSIIAKLPCLLHGRYSHGTGKPVVGEKDICLVRARVWTRSPYQSRNTRRLYIGSMLHRTAKGSISRPGISEGWYWVDELQAAFRAGVITRISDDRYYEWVKYEPCDCPPPMADMVDLYDARLQYGKDTPLGKASKTTYNSAYGKTAQSEGMPEFGNAIYASRITSGTRTMILDAIATHPEKTEAVVMVATDAVFFLTPHPGLPISKRLGEWDHTERSNLTLFKPGVYWDDETRRQIREHEKPKFKARGINAAEFAASIAVIDMAFNDWEPGQEVTWPRVQFHTSFSVVTLKQALARGKWHTAGRNEPKNPTQVSDPYLKRGPVYYDDKRNIWRSEILWPAWNENTGDFECVSFPYEKRFGLEDPFSDVSKEEAGINEDGLVGDQFSWLLKNDE